MLFICISLLAICHLNKDQDWLLHCWLSAPAPTWPFWLQHHQYIFPWGQEPTSRVPYQYFFDNWNRVLDIQCFFFCLWLILRKWLCDMWIKLSFTFCRLLQCFRISLKSLKSFDRSVVFDSISQLIYFKGKDITNFWTDKESQAKIAKVTWGEKSVKKWFCKFWHVLKGIW